MAPIGSLCVRSRAQQEWWRAMPNRCDSFVLGCLAFCSPLIAFAAGAPAPFAPPQAEQMSLFQGATLIDGTGAVARANVDVLVDGERIRSIAPHGDLGS